MDKTAITLEAISKEIVDLENIPLEEVFEKLKCTREGLSLDEVEKRLKVFGYNKLEEKKENKIIKFLGFMWNPLSWVMEAAAIMAISLALKVNENVDYITFLGILALHIINSAISFVEENKTGNAVAGWLQKQQFYELANGVRNMLLCWFLETLSVSNQEILSLPMHVYLKEIL